MSPKQLFPITVPNTLHLLFVTAMRIHFIIVLILSPCNSEVNLFSLSLGILSLPSPQLLLRVLGTFLN
jgi:hypothetical protein